ncbi:DUF3509 domain-containing protein [Pseudomonas matsuisoli]|uniref:DUF3509 domain-containing protein n=1 Tax=Pseudomonas matsuisoli TaxID=1515666 RepID=A0A917PSG1_9PSED|nr:DUF3509 domain-containing protein [Pseudomonas matsuisoli]GGJ89982.1 hypothetical protein GCM10009304_14400 [Pseudomonas matsuisoli]
MTSIVQHIISSFPDYSIASKQRPDGFLLEFTRADNSIEFRRVLPKQCASQTDTDAFIHGVRRDLALLNGQVPPRDSLRKLRNIGLPSYM